MLVVKEMSEAKDLDDLLQETADDLLANAERCYRLARGTTDFRARTALMGLGHEFEAKAEALKQEPHR